MFRDKEIVALNDVLVQCETNAGHLRHTADLLKGGEDNALLRRLADERMDLVARLRDRMMQHGELADTVDTERDALHDLGETLASKFAAWGREELLEARIDDDKRLVAAAEQALALAIPADYRRLLEQVREQAEAGVGSLRKSHAGNG